MDSDSRRFVRSLPFHHPIRRAAALLRGRRYAALRDRCDLLEPHDELARRERAHRNALAIVEMVRSWNAKLPYIHNAPLIGLDEVVDDVVRGLVIGVRQPYRERIDDGDLVLADRVYKLVVLFDDRRFIEMYVRSGDGPPNVDVHFAIARTEALRVLPSQREETTEPRPEIHR